MNNQVISMFEILDNLEIIKCGQWHYKISFEAVDGVVIPYSKEFVFTFNEEILN